METPLEKSVLVTLLLPGALAVIMLGLGLSLTLDDFRRVAKVPRAVVVAMVCQCVLLPVGCWLIVHGFHLQGALAVGLMLLSASPGGASANLFSHLAGGDVALNITLTAVNSVLSFFTLPIIVGLSLSAFMAEDRTVDIGFTKVVQVFATVLVPVAIGMFVRSKREAFAKKLDRPVRIFSFGFLVLGIIGAVVKERTRLPGYFEQIGGAALAFNLLSLAVGYFVPRLFRIDRRQSVAIGMEIGVHNGMLAIAVASSPLMLNNAQMAVPAAIYSVIMFFTASAFGWAMSRVDLGEPEPDDGAAEPRASEG
ncbi:MAG: bile acid:sodium symporter family protein [Myxococcaceae bacterium]|nr:bile acid:sodium symporter family protein [Myxococcaceae bacterium]